MSTCSYVTAFRNTKSQLYCSIWQGCSPRSTVVNINKRIARSVRCDSRALQFHWWRKSPCTVMQWSKWWCQSSAATRTCSSTDSVDPCWDSTASRSCSCRRLTPVCCCTTATRLTAPATSSHWLCATDSSSAASTSALEPPSFGTLQLPWFFTYC